MMSRKIGVILVVQFLLLHIGAFSQNINCDRIYWVHSSRISEFNPATEMYAYTGINTPSESGGLGIGKDIINKTDKLVFFTSVEKKIHYYNGTSWINTGFSSGSVNLGGGNDYWYILDGSASNVYKFDGKS